MKKKLLAVGLLAALICLMIATAGAFQWQAWRDGVAYVLDDETGYGWIQSDGYDESDMTPDVTILSEVDGYRINAITGCAFYGCNTLVNLTIPDSITRIEGSAFTGCHNLLTVNLPSSVTSIESGTFAECTSLKTLTIPANIKSIEKGSSKIAAALHP